MTARTLDWRKMDISDLPPARSGGVMINNSRDQTTYIIGGFNSSIGYLNDTWVANGPKWVQRLPSVKPTARIGMCSTWDENQQTAVLFGGMRDNSLMGETWIFNGTNWNLQQPMYSPSPRINAAMAYDVARNRTILFGGEANVGKKYLEHSNETWAWDGKEWQQLHLSNIPPARSGAGLAYDKTHQSMLLFGGAVGGGIRDDTWIWNGSDWIEQQPYHKPPARTNFGMTYHPILQQIILFGGQSYDDIVNDTWIWDGKDWMQLQTKQSPPKQMAWGNRLVYMPSLNAIVLYNAYRDKVIISDEEFSVIERSEFWILDN